MSHTDVPHTGAAIDAAIDAARNPAEANRW